MISLGIIGGGFSGLAVLAATVRHAVSPLHITVYNPSGALGRGKAYSTLDDAHLLNVRAGAMGVLAGEDDDFFLWLIAQGLAHETSDFVPRAVYGRYLDNVLAETLVEAQKKDIRIFILHEKVARVRADGDGFKVEAATETKHHDAVVLACGNDRPRLPVLTDKVAAHAGWWRHPYIAERWPDIQKAGHIVIIGSGLSMIDALVTLKREGYDGDITVVSSHGRHPLSHPDTATSFMWDEADALFITSLSTLVRQVKLKAAAANADWRDVLDGLRPYANQIWRNFSAADRQRAQRYMSLWNLCRHRIPPAMHTLVRESIGQGQLRMIAGRVNNIEAMGSSLNVYTSAGVKEAQIVMNCMGYDYKVTPDDKGLLARAVKSGLVTLSDGLPQLVNDSLQLHNDHALYAVGPLLQGHFIESTAVREIRQQADVVARHILEKMD